MTALYPGKLRGYRHFSWTPSRVVEEFHDLSDFSSTQFRVHVEARQTPTRITSPSQTDYQWVDGPNTAGCVATIQRPEFYEQQIRELEVRLKRAEQDEYYRYLGTYGHWSRSPHVTVNGDNPRLLQGTLRTAKDNLEHARKVYGPDGHLLKHCTCGFYVSYSPETNFYADHGRHPFSGFWMDPIPGLLHAVVDCWGTVILATKGFRASKLEVVALTPGPRYADTVTGNAELRLLAQQQFPSARWYDSEAKMIADHPEPDRTGLPVEGTEAYR
ncbi:hypothetical protein [Streptomyces sp. NPDC015131]|uniref:hypothetical protein n=1 Tax=Streptomyces sp. NPDC015131 TaxID=3364941 RepID=UPI0036F87878